MILASLLLAMAQTVPAEGVPAAAIEPLSHYMTCLLEPLDQMTVPQSIEGRQAMVRGIVGRCADVRRTSAAEADHVLAMDPAYVDATARQTAVSAFFSHWEQLLHSMVVEHERFVEADWAYEECVDRGDAEQC